MAIGGSGSSGGHSSGGYSSGGHSGDGYSSGGCGAQGRNRAAAALVVVGADQPVGSAADSNSWSTSCSLHLKQPRKLAFMSAVMVQRPGSNPRRLI